MSACKIMVGEKQAEEVRIDQYLTIFNYFTKSDYEAISLVTAHLNGPHSNRVNRRSVKLYFLTEGTLDIVVDGVQHRLHQQDALLVPPNKWHTMEGHNARMLIICAPAYDAADEEIEG